MVPTLRLAVPPPGFYHREAESRRALTAEGAKRGAVAELKVRIPVFLAETHFELVQTRFQSVPGALSTSGRSGPECGGHA